MICLVSTIKSLTATAVVVKPALVKRRNSCPQCVIVDSLMTSEPCWHGQQRHIDLLLSFEHGDERQAVISLTLRYSLPQDFWLLYCHLSHLRLHLSIVWSLLQKVEAGEAPPRESKPSANGTPNKAGKRILSGSADAASIHASS